MKASSGNSYKSKIILIGPSKSGKSVLANFLGDQVRNYYVLLNKNCTINNTFNNFRYNSCTDFK